MSQAAYQPTPGAPQATQPPETSRLSRLGAAIIGAGSATTAVATIGAVLLRGDQPYWMVVGFELVVLTSAVFAILIARGRFRDGPAMALLCVSGTLLVSGVLGYISTKPSAALLLRGRPVAMKPWALLHIAGASVMGAVAAYEVLRRNSRSLYYLSRAVMAGVPLAAMAAVAWMLYRRSQASEASYQAIVDDALTKGMAAPPPPDPLVPSWVTWLGGSLGSVLALVLFCACAHCVIRAFEMGRPRA